MQSSPCQDADPSANIHSSGPNGEPFGSSQHVESVIKPGQRETVLPCDIITFL
jgi:hypothetical protein